MLKNISKLGKVLTRSEQKTVSGAAFSLTLKLCVTSCTGHPSGTSCSSYGDCVSCPGVCSGGTCYSY